MQGSSAAGHGENGGDMWHPLHTAPCPVLGTVWIKAILLWSRPMRRLSPASTSPGISGLEEIQAVVIFLACWDSD